MDALTARRAAFSLTGMKRFIGDPLAAMTLILAAVLLGISFQGPGLTPLAWIGLTAIAFVIHFGYFKLLPAYAAGILLQLAGVDWMRHCFSTLAVTESRLTNWLLLGLAFGTVLPVVLALGAWLRRCWPLWLIMPVVWTIGDLLRYEEGYLISRGPYPWMSLALTQTDFVIPCQVADLGGMWAVGFIAAMFSGMIAQSIVERRALVVPMLILCAAIIYGQWRVSSTTFSQGPTIALMPGQNLKVPLADFALWSETTFEQSTPLPTSTILVQGYVRQDNQKVFNSIALLKDGQLVDHYDKCNLVPWSEFLPWGGPGRQLTAGDKLGVFECGRFRFGAAVCYDVCFSEFMRRLASEHPQFVVIPANESSDPSMMLAHQLLAQTRLRAIEMRKAIVRNANGGFSGIVDGNGRLIPAPLDFREPVIVGPVPLDDRFSPYTWLDGWLPVACVLAVFLTVCRRPRLQSVPLLAGDVVEHETHGPIAQ